MSSSTLVSGAREYSPDPTVPRERFKFDRDSPGGKLALMVSRDSGNSWKSIASEPPSNAGEGWIPTIGENGVIKWVSPSTILRAAQLSERSEGFKNLTWVDFSFPGEIVKDKSFGLFEVPAGLSFLAYGVQITCFAPPSTPTVSVTLKNITSGVSHNHTKTFLLQGQIYTSSIFTSEVEMESLSKFQFFVTHSDADAFPGSYIVCRLLIKSIT